MNDLLYRHIVVSSIKITYFEYRNCWGIFMQNSILLFDLISYCCYVIANYMNNYAINLEPKKEVTHKHVNFDIADKKIIYKVEVIKVANDKR